MYKTSTYNNNNKVIAYKEYYKNGQLKEVGKQKTEGGEKIGKWKYYDELYFSYRRNF